MTQFIDLINLYMKNVSINTDKDGQQLVCGTIDSLELYTRFLTELKAIDFSFSTRSCTRPRPTPRKKSKTKGLAGEICFESKRAGCQIPFFGLPFVVERTIYLQCSYGKKYYGDKYKEKMEQNPTCNKQRRREIPSKKIGCPAKMSVKQVRIFSDFAIKDRNWRSKKEMLRILKKAIRSDTPPKSTLRFLIVLSTQASHSHPIVPMPNHQKLHKDLVKEIRNLVRNGICTVKLIKSHLLEYVRAMFLNSDVKPDPSNTCYYPKNKIIYNHMRRAMAEMNNNCDKEAEVPDCAEQWVEIITSGPAESAPVNDRVLEDISELDIEPDLEPEPIEEEPTVFFTIVKSNSMTVELQQSCKGELSKIEKLLSLCTDESYLHDLLTSLEHLTKCTEEYVGDGY